MNITINNQSVEAQDGETVFEAAARLQIEIPTLCHHPDLTPVGSCRLCLVEVDGHPRPQTACNCIVQDGMNVVTENGRLSHQRKLILEQLLEDFCQSGRTGKQEAVHQSEFDRWVEHYGARSPDANRARYPVDADPNPFIAIDLNQCILCTRCVRACEEVQGRFVWNVAQRGDDTRVVCGNDTTMLEARCESCGACAAYCPTGALSDRFEISNPTVDRKVRTTCPYCGVGCQFDLNIKDERIVRVSSSADAPVNGMSLCVKGRYGFEFVHHADRIARPRVRKYLLDDIPWQDRPHDRGDWIEVDWPKAIDLVTRRFSEILQSDGPQAIGVMSSAKCTNEENYLMQKFARQVIGTHNIDHCARLCHSSTVAGLGMAIGSGAMSNSMDDIAQYAEAVLIIGSNTTEQHPVFGAMLRQAALQRGIQIIVADPRRIDITEFAAMHLRQEPGTDVALINGLMHIAVKNNWHDRTFIENRCEEFSALEELLERYPPEIVAEITGVPPDDLQKAASILCENKPMAVIWAMGITQHITGVMNVLSLANLQLLLGNMGVAGGGVNPLRGQNNVQGACDMGCLPNVFPGYQRVSDTKSVGKFDQAWQLTGTTPNPSMAEYPTGLTVTEMIEAAGNHEIRSLYILGENPAMTEPDSNHAQTCLRQTEFVVLQEILDSETASFADVILPGASFAEKNGTFTNTERRIQPVRQAIDPIGDSREDWEITSELARCILKETRRDPVGSFARWDYQSAAAILKEINQLTPSYAGATAERIESGERLQWPIPDSTHAGTRIMHTETFPRGRGKFHAIDHLPPAELPDEQFPFLLTTGRVLYHWHGEMTRRVAGLQEICPEPEIEISPHDANRLLLKHQHLITVRSRRGQLTARAIVTNRVSAGIIFANFHFPGSGNANNLTIGELDPIAKIPEYKVCAVSIIADDVNAD